MYYVQRERERELSDGGVAEEMQDGLDKTNVLTLKEHKEATNTRKIPTSIADSEVRVWVVHLGQSTQ